MMLSKQANEATTNIADHSSFKVRMYLIRKRRSIQAFDVTLRQDCREPFRGQVQVMRVIPKIASVGAPLDDRWSHVNFILLTHFPVGGLIMRETI
jgi:hypothetical protein